MQKFIQNNKSLCIVNLGISIVVKAAVALMAGR